MFEPLPAKFDFPTAERQVLDFWDRNGIFEKSLQQRAGSPRFVFYEGPPTANGLPHPGHALTRAIKDIFPRYKTMTGHLVERKAGWDTHGLPVEVEVCKELGIHTKQEIEAYGVEKFVHRCIESVFRYTKEWEEMTRRLGFWVNLDDAYVTYHQSYVESVWWSLKTLFERGLLYQGHKVVWWWAQGGTALSAGEVGEGYRQVDDPSVFVKFPDHFGPLVLPKDVAAGFTENDRIERVWALVEQAEKTAELMKHEAAGGDHLGARLALNFLANLPGFLVEGEADELKTLVALRERGRDVVEKLARPWSLLVWTTTPWTLVSNHFAAVHPDLDYALVHDAAGAENLFVATGLVESLAKKLKRELSVVLTCKGTDLIGESYVAPFPEAYCQANVARMPTFGWRVVAGDFVTTDSGTGIVHVAPAFGEADFSLLQRERELARGVMELPVLCAVNPDGTFNDDAPQPYRGRWVKDCDKEIVRELRDTRKTPWGTPLLYHQEQYRHDYPFCPRSPEDPLIQYARKSWFVRTSQFKDEFLKNNDKINWLPEHIKEGRFGDFLRNNVDWALSRERYWGTPLPIWVCEKTGRMEALGSFEEMKAKPGATDVSREFPEGFWATKSREATAEGRPLPEHLKVHKPYIDEWTYDSKFAEEGTEAQRHEGTKGKARMRRVPEVIDCWWDAGSMPFAQWGFPHTPGSVPKLMERLPADFISEAIDQTRGWFYGLLSISTLLFSQKAFETQKPIVAKGNSEEESGRLIPFRMAVDYPLPFRTCIVLGHMFGEDGNKMSKRLRNYKEPSYVFDTLGADAMRWYFFSAQAPWTSTRFVEASIRDAQREFLVRLYNVFSFFNIYANIDGFEAIPDAAHGHRPTAQRSELDRWIISELMMTVRFVRESMDRFENFPAAGRLNDFVDALSNWYVRRSRDRFWRAVGANDERGTLNAEKSAEAKFGAGDSSAFSVQNSAFSAADQDKWDAYHTLYGCLYTLSMLIAPFTPFFAETIFQNLTNSGATCRAGQDSGNADEKEKLSVHLCDYPEVIDTLIDENLAAQMDVVRDLVSLGRASRTAAKLKVRQPLSLVEIILSRRDHEQWLQAHSDLIAEELNVKRVEFATQADHYVSYQIKPDFKAIGPKFGKLAPKIAAALTKLDPAAARNTLIDKGELPLTVDGQEVLLTKSEIEVRLEAKPGWSAVQGRAGVVVVKTDVTPELRDEGLVREFMHEVQGIRKELNLPYEARIALYVQTDDEMRQLIERFAEEIRRECLVEKIAFETAPDVVLREFTIEDHRVALAAVTG